ncbi:MAG: alpha-ketoacid dehydrogenase subunit beta [Verrucomicrobia bacterium]|nr:alpha-ketoacid dehydrogenase subunit beta [Verrucomicrobiota bacterium]
MNRQIRYNEAILEATDLMMEKDPSVYIMGLGVPDPKGIFGTTNGLEKKYGPNRVMDMPTSENAMTGVAIGSAIAGMRPIMTHQRVDFFLLALDQLINNGSKWHYMFNRQMSVPLVIRLIIGRGWGQGPQHSQSLQSLFAHIPGLKVVMPSNPYDAKGLLISSIEDNNPVIYLEHRWLHGIFGDVPKELYRVPIGKAKILQEGTDITLIASSHMTLESWRAIQLLKDEGISIEMIDVRTIRPLDEDTILSSICKTGRLIVVDPDWKCCGLASEIVALASEQAFSFLKHPPVRITYPDRMTPTSWKLANHFYPTAKHIAAEILKMMNKPNRSKDYLEEAMKQAREEPLDVPNKEFCGPF